MNLSQTTSDRAAISRANICELDCQFSQAFPNGASSKIAQTRGLPHDFRTENLQASTDFKAPVVEPPVQYVAERVPREEKKPKDSPAMVTTLKYVHGTMVVVEAKPDIVFRPIDKTMA